MEPVRLPSLWILLLGLWLGAANPAWAYYHPGVGRWLSRDPLGERGGLHLSSFVANRPTTQTDPLGLRAGHPQRDLHRYKSCRRLHLNARLTQGGTGPGAYRQDCCELVTILVKLPSCTATGADGKGLGGHTGLGIGNQFYDYGPGAPIKVLNAFTGVPGQPWWDDPAFGLWDPDVVDSSDDILLGDILSALPTVLSREPYGPEGEPRDVFKIEIAVSPEAARALRDDWEARYHQLGTYRLLGDQCTSTVMKSLHRAGIHRRPFLTFTPVSFLKSLARANHQCGPHKGQRARIEQISSEPVTRPCP